MDKNIILIIAPIVLIGLAIFGWQSGWFAKSEPIKPAVLPDEIVLFFGAECPHCKNVEDFVQANNIEQKVQFTRLEVPFGDKTSAQLVANAKLVIQTAQSCKIDMSNGVSIPFLYDGKGNCFLGDVDVINFFKNAADIK